MIESATFRRAVFYILVYIPLKRGIKWFFVIVVLCDMNLIDHYAKVIYNNTKVYSPFLGTYATGNTVIGVERIQGTSHSP